MNKSAIAYVHPEVDWGFQARAIGVTTKSILHDFLFEAYTRASVGDGLDLRIRIEPVAGEHVGYLVLLSDEEKEFDCGREETSDETGEGRQEESQEGQEESGKGQEPAAVPSLPAQRVLDDATTAHKPAGRQSAKRKRPTVGTRAGR